MPGVASAAAGICAVSNVELETRVEREMVLLSGVTNCSCSPLLKPAPVAVMVNPGPFEAAEEGEAEESTGGTLTWIVELLVPPEGLLTEMLNRPESAVS
ncbi:MAG: hypothetical protein QM757_46895 [Paludibaculum sp.]